MTDRTAAMARATSNFHNVDCSSGMQLATAVSDLLARGWTTAVPYADLTGLGRAALDAARHTFVLPTERKAMFVDPSGAGNIGWRPASRDDRPNEVWQLSGAEPDLWPAELEADRAAVHRVRTRCAEIVADLLEALAPALGLPPDELRQCVSAADSVARLLHYAPRTGGIGFAPHTDLRSGNLLRSRVRAVAGAGGRGRTMAAYQVGLGRGRGRHVDHPCRREGSRRAPPGPFVPTGTMVGGGVCPSTANLRARRRGQRTTAHRPWVLRARAAGLHDR